MRRALALALSLAPGLANACPACARDSTPGAWLLVAALVASPYLVVLGVVRAIRRAEQGDGR
jgi:hypothetical protein